MSRFPWFRASLAAAACCSSCVLVFAWQKEAAPAKKAPGGPTPAAQVPAPAAKPADDRNETVKRQALLAEWGVRKREEASNAAGIHRALRTKTKFAVKEVTLEAAIEKLAKDHDLQILIDKPTLQDEGISLELPVTLAVADITLRSVLKLVLEPQQLAYVIRNEVLMVTTETKASDQLVTRIYDIRPVLEGDRYASLIDMITSCIQPETWDEVGGPGSIKPVHIAQALSIRQTQAVHDEIASILAEVERQLSVPTGTPPAAPLLDANREAEQSIRAKLAAKGNLKCRDETLESALRRIAGEHRLPLWIDRATLQDEGISTETPVALDVRDVRLESALELLIEPLQLKWVIEDEVLKITTSTRASERLSTRVYDVRDLEDPKNERAWPPSRPGGGGMGGGGGGSGSTSGAAGGGGLFDVPVTILKQGFFGPGGGSGSSPPMQLPRFATLIDLLTSNLQPESWDDVGGPGSIKQYRGLLVVRQTAEVHSGIESYLQELRMFVIRKQLEMPKAKPEDAEEVTLVVYQLEDYPPNDLDKLIAEVVAPQTWKAAGGKGTIHVQPRSLVIRQTRAVHDEIVKLLYAVVAKSPQ